MLRLFVLVVALTLSACDSRVTSPLPSNFPVYVYSGEARIEIPPSDSRHHQLLKWIERNREGWSQVYATNPSGGILVSAGDWHLQFVDSVVFFTSKDGMLTKSVEESEYAFLMRPPGT